MYDLSVSTTQNRTSKGWKNTFLGKSFKFVGFKGFFFNLAFVYTEDEHKIMTQE